MQSKLCPRKIHATLKGEQRYSSSLSLTSALDGVGDQRQAPTVLFSGKRPGVHSTEAWVGPGPVWTGAENVDTLKIYIYIYIYI
jgi:hypothetical protein